MEKKKGFRLMYLTFSYAPNDPTTVEIKEKEDWQVISVIIIKNSSKR